MNIKKIENDLLEEIDVLAKDDFTLASSFGKYFMLPNGKFVKSSGRNHGDMADRFMDELEIVPTSSLLENNRMFMEKSRFIICNLDVTEDIHPMITFSMVGKPTGAQLNRIEKYEKDGHIVGFDILKTKQGDQDWIFGKGVKALKEELLKPGF